MIISLNWSWCDGQVNAWCDLAGSSSAITSRMMMIMINVVAAVVISALVADYEVEDQHCSN
jgi:hypothetical protein